MLEPKAVAWEPTRAAAIGRRFGDPHEGNHSMAERLEIADQLAAAGREIERLTADNERLRAALEEVKHRLEALAAQGSDDCNKPHDELDPLERCTCGFAWPRGGL